MLTITQYLLAQLIQECGEVAHDTSKALLFGLDERNITMPANYPTNRERIVEELNDLAGTIRFMVQEGIIPAKWADNDRQQAKMAKIAQYMQHSKKNGILDDGMGDEQ